MGEESDPNHTILFHVLIFYHFKDLNTIILRYFSNWSNQFPLEWQGLRQTPHPLNLGINSLWVWTSQVKSFIQSSCGVMNSLFPMHWGRFLVTFVYRRKKFLYLYFGYRQKYLWTAWTEKDRVCCGLNCKYFPKTCLLKVWWPIFVAIGRVEPFEVWPVGSKLGYWECALEGAFWNPSPSLFFSSGPIISMGQIILFHHVLPLPYTVHSQAQSDRAKWPWTETMSQNKLFLLISSLSQVFCDTGRNQINTGEFTPALLPLTTLRLIWFWQDFLFYSGEEFPEDSVLGWSPPLSLVSTLSVLKLYWHYLVPNPPSLLPTLLVFLELWYPDSTLSFGFLNYIFDSYQVGRVFGNFFYLFIKINFWRKRSRRK